MEMIYVVCILISFNIKSNLGSIGAIDDDLYDEIADLMSKGPQSNNVKSQMKDVKREQSPVLPDKSNAQGDVSYTFTKKELAEMFGVHQPDDVPTFKTTSIKGLSKFKWKDNEDEEISLDAFGKPYRLNVRFDNDVVPESHTLEFADSNGNIHRKFKGTLGKYLSGQVEDDEESNVALYYTGKGVTGSIRTSDDLFFVTPLPHRLKDENADHVIYRVNDLPGGDDLKALLNAKDVEPRLMRKRSTNTNYPKKTMELLIVGDYKFLEDHGEFAPQYLLTAANVMASVFRDSSLEYPLTVAVTRRIIFDTNVFQAKSMTDYLDKFANWAVINHVASDSEDSNVDAAVLVTRKGACEDECGEIGYGKKQACGKRAEAVVRDDGLIATALAMAHEIGHILLLEHDGISPNTACPDGYYIMASGTKAGGSQSFQWSQCASDKIKELLLSDRSLCYNDEPRIVISNATYELYGRDYDRDKQCGYLLGSQYKGCTASIIECQENREFKCDKTVCQVPGVNTVSIQPFPLLHGTSCGANKWCIYGNCIPDGTNPPAPVDGQWGPWGDYGECSRKCHIGLQSKYRECIGTANGGQYCTGGTPGQKQSGFTIPCRVTDETCTPGSNDRDQQCTEQSRGKSCHNCVVAEGNECILFCEDRTGHDSVTDGTACSNSLIHDGICVSGKCKRMFCDETFDSGAEVDRCFVCGGSGTTCKEVTDVKAKISGADTVTIPANSWRISVKKLECDAMFLGFKLGSSNSYAMQHPYIYSQSTTIDGVLYKMTTSDVNDATYHHCCTISVDRPIKEEMHMKVKNVQQNSGISWEYLTNSPSTLGDVYWYPEAWTPCSLACGSGVRSREIHCKRQDDDTIISPNFCPSESQPVATESCAVIDCDPKWTTGSWSSCDKPCEAGTRSRTITCIKLTASKDLETVEDAKCEGTPMPNDVTSEECNVHACDPTWVVVSDYSDCSKSCGSGVSTREVVCKRVMKNGVNEVVRDLECESFQGLSKPVSEMKCNEDVVCPLWNTQYTKCSTTCGEGTQSVSVICKESPSDNLLPDSSCKAEDKPTVSSLVHCNEGICPGFEWATTDGPCSAACGDGLIHVSITCTDVTTKQAADHGNCDTASKPYSQVFCNLGECVKIYTWKTRMSDCSKSCGPGTQSTIPYCVRISDNVEVEIVDCDLSEQPAVVTTECNIKDCPTHEWIVELGECSPCLHDESDGFKSIIVSCQRLADKVIVADSYCGGDKPDSPKGSCKCPEVDYDWKLKQSSCSASCGPGTISQEYICVDSNNVQAQHEEDCSRSEAKPVIAPTIACQERVCPVYEYATEYGACNTDCGNGYKITYVQCVDSSTVPSTVVDGAYCSSRHVAIPAANVACTVMEGGVEIKCEKVDPEHPEYDVYPVGCFEDKLNGRLFPENIASYRDYFDWIQVTVPVKYCYTKTKEKNRKNKRSNTGKIKYTYFAIQYYGECWVGNEDRTYDKYGATTDCWEKLGKKLTNFVYHIGSPVVPKNAPLLQLGCYNYKDKPLMDAKYAWSGETHNRYVSDCVRTWNKELDGNRFGIDSTGKCLSWDEQKHIWDEHDLINPCKPVEGELTKRYFLYEIMT